MLGHLLISQLAQPSVLPGILQYSSLREPCAFSAFIPPVPAGMLEEFFVEGSGTVTFLTNCPFGQA